MGWQSVFAALLQAGNTIVIDSDGQRIYDGPPAAGNLLASFAPTEFVDSAGNDVLPFFTVYDYAATPLPTALQMSGNRISYYQSFGSGLGSWGVEDFIQFNLSNTFFNLPLVIEGSIAPGPASFGNVVAYSNLNGALSAVDSTDGQAYMTERNTAFLDGTNQTITSTTFTDITNLTFPVSVPPGPGARAYRIHGEVYVTANNANGGFAFRWSGTAASGTLHFKVTSLTSIWDQPPAPIATAVNPGLTMVSSQVYVCSVDGYIRYNVANGTFLLQAAVTNAAGSITIDQFSYLDIMPVF